MLHEPSTENLRVGPDPWIPRLPTPGIERSAFISPPMSRTSSGASLASVGDRTFSHLRPLPSPGPDHHSHSPPSTAEDVSPTAPSKTHAFFSSPFSIAIARTPPTQPPSRSASLAIPKKATRDALDHTPSVFTTEPTSVAASDAQPATNANRTPTNETSINGPPSRSQTASANFFGPPSAASLSTPTPPPNLEPVRKRVTPSLPGLATLSRFFPSRLHKPTDTTPIEGQIHITEPTPLATPHAILNEKLPVLSPPPDHRGFVDLRIGRDDKIEIEGPARPSPDAQPERRLRVPSPSRARQASPERLLAHSQAFIQDAQQHGPLRRETDRHVGFATPDPFPGQIIGEPDTPLKLIKVLGQGAFSSVWLATDETAELALTRSTSIGKGLSRKGSSGKRVLRRRRQSQSHAKTDRDRKMGGMKPPILSSPTEADEATSPVDSHGRVTNGALSISPKLDSPIRTLLTSQSYASLRAWDKPGGRLVAVKMMDRAMCDANDRTRISFVREVEVLRHISHPSIVSYLHSFDTPNHHCLVLEHIQGGELFELLNTDEKHARLTEPLLRKMFTELCRAVAWMHSVALVHRDIKLENILLRCDPFAPEFIPEGSTSPSLDLLPTPLLKLTDFGLSRFIDPENPLLSTRCGSESYAAPEIVMAMKYDGRQTDAWACGVVLFALATRVLPFDRVAVTGPGSVGSGGSDRGGSLASPNGSVTSSIGGKGRRSYLIRIAKNEYSWPTEESSTRLATQGLRNVVERLLVRDSRKRATIAQLWDEEWMNGEGSMPKPREGYRINIDEDFSKPPPQNEPPRVETTETRPEEEVAGAEVQESECDGEADEAEPDPDSGLLVNGESISNVAKQDIN